MVDISVGPVDLEAELVDGGLKIKVELDFKVLEYSWEAVLSVSNPSISFDTGSVADFSASVSVGIDSYTGELGVEVKVCHPVYDFPFGVHQECESFGKHVNVLPPGVFCLLEYGITKAGIEWLLKNHPTDKPSCSDMKKILDAVGNDFWEANEVLRSISSQGLNLVEATGNAIAERSPSEINGLRTLSPQKWEEVLHAVVINPQINEIYPGIAEKFSLSVDNKSHKAVDGDAKDVIVMIAEALGVEVGLIVAVAAVIGVIVGVVAAAGTIGTALTVGIVVVLALGLIAIIVAGVIISVIMVALTIITIVDTELFHNRVNPDLMMPGQSLLATV